MFKSETIDYHDGDTLLEGYCIYDEKGAEKKPAVLVVHDWSGKNDFSVRKAQQLAELGYIGFAVDMYGKGVTGATKEEKTALVKPFFEDRYALQKRILAALETVKKIPAVDTSRIGAIGFCFGGLCVLDLARSGANVKGVVSFHGLLNEPEDVKRGKILAKILVLHGYDDPMCKPDEVLRFCNEMTNDKVDWQVDMYSNTMHAFTNPQANDPDFGTVYNASSDARSWEAMKYFFKEVFV